jgi:uncharacterized protein involved in exopolysaccharide biosynthesis
VQPTNWASENAEGRKRFTEPRDNGLLMTHAHNFRDLQVAGNRVVRLAPRLPAFKTPKPAAGLFGRFGLKRSGWRDLTIGRVIRGGRVSDLGRIGRYCLIVAAGLGLAWGPAITYVKFGSISYTSQFSLILPGAGAASSINLSDIGQASSASASAFSGSSISPTVTYKNLMMSANVVQAAAKSLNENATSFPVPTVKLVDETSFIAVEIPGPSAEAARNRAQAIMNAFFAELNILRADETARRDAATIETVKNYEKVVNDVRDKISALQLKSGLTSYEQFNAYVTAADALSNRIAEGEAELSKTSRSRAGLATTLNLTDRLAALTMKLHADPEFAGLADATAKADAEHASTAQQFGAKHPKVVDARTRLEGARAQMMRRASKITGIPVKKIVGKIDFAPTGERAALLSQLVSLTSNAQGLDGQITTMKTELKERRKQIAQLVNVAADLERLNSEHKVAEAVFASALARISTSKTDIFASYPMAQVSEAPVVPLTPSSPNKKIAFGAAVGSTLLLFLALLLAWVRRPVIDKLLNLARKPDGQAKPA